MTDFIRFNPASGEVISAGSVPESMLHLQGEHVLVGKFDPALHYVDLATKVVVRMPPRPSAQHDFNYASRTWGLNLDRAWVQARGRRDQLLAACDWVVTRAADRGEPVPTDWQVYRQALRDITDQPDPMGLVWPERPG